MPLMGLRARLALFFVAITVVPLTVAVIALQVQIEQQLRSRAEADIVSVRSAATRLLEELRARAGDLATDLVVRGAAEALVAGDPAEAQRWLDAEARDGLGTRADVLALVDGGGNTLAVAATEGRFAPGFEAPDADGLAAAATTGQLPAGVLVEVREVHGAPPGEQERLLGWVVAGLWADERTVERLPIVGGAGFAVDGQVIAAVGPAAQVVAAAGVVPPPGAVRWESPDETEVLLTAADLGPPDADAQTTLLVWAPAVTRPTTVGPALSLLIPSVVLAAALGWFLASGVATPIARAAEVARAVAAGDLNQPPLEERGGKEVRGLSAALNAMSRELAAQLEEIRRSRDEVRSSLVRFGEMLSGSLDLNRILSAVVDAAIQTLGADRAVLLMLTPERDALYLKVGRGIDEPRLRMRVGEGVAGFVAQSGTPLLLPQDAERIPQPVDGEPMGAHELAIPLLARGHVIGVLALMRDDPEAPFGRDDLNTVRSFAAQLSVAIENVMLHREAQRLSLTDPLTGLWNFRYFQQQVERELESAVRFDRPLSLLIIDLDHFKDVNDQLGHQVGDEVLTEVARRIRDETRAPDVAARYGGEEFVLLLPGTGYEGALTTAERIRGAVADTPVTITVTDVPPLHVTCSIGAVTYPEHGRTVAELVRGADSAMYTAKTQGRNRVVGAEDVPSSGPQHDGGD
jgi:two-component system, cell cycle response regulator